MSNLNNFGGSLDSIAQASVAPSFGGQNLNNYSTPAGGNSFLQSNYDFGAPAPSNEAQGAITMQVRKLYLGLTRPQGDQHRRSYDVGLDGTGLNAIHEAVNQHGAQAFNSTNMSSLMSNGANIIKPAGTAEAAVGIDHGWASKRYRFTMVVDIFRNTRFDRTEFISGYTDYDGAINAGMISSVAIDPQMIFIVNHVTEARLRKLHNGVPVPVVQRSSGVVRNNGFTGLGQPEHSLYMTRVSDVMKAVDKVQLYQGMQASAEFGDHSGAAYQDLDSMLTSVPMMAADTNMLLPTFTSNALSSLYSHSLSSFDPMNMDNTTPGQMSALSTQDTAFSKGSFVHVMNRLCGNGVQTSGVFTYGDLLRMDPTIDDRADIFGLSYTSGAIVIPDGTDTHALGAAETISLHATSISQSILALMSMSGVATLAMNANNMATGNTEIIIQACDGLDNDGMLANRLEVLKTRFKVECLNIMSINDEITFEVDIFADAFNDVFIQLSWDGVYRTYVIPAFASSSFAPIVTNNLSNLIGMAEAMGQVVDTCKTIINPGMISTGTDHYVQGQGNTDWMGRNNGLSGDY